MFKRKQKTEGDIEQIKESRITKIKNQIKEVDKKIDAKNKEIETIKEEIISLTDILHTFEEKVDHEKKNKNLFFKQIQELQVQKQRLEIELHNYENEAHIEFLKEQHVDPVAYEGVLKKAHEEQAKNEKLILEIKKLTDELEASKKSIQDKDAIIDKLQPKEKKHSFLPIFGGHKETKLEEDMKSQILALVHDLKAAEVKKFEEKYGEFEKLQKDNDEKEIENILSKYSKEMSIIENYVKTIKGETPHAKKNEK